MIADGRTIFGAGLNEGLHGQRLDAVARKTGRRVPSFDRVAEDAPPLLARVQVGPIPDTEAGPHWVVTCDQCGSVSAVWLDALLLLCPKCWNTAYGKRWRRVGVPDEDMRAEIDRLLSLRPIKNRWWNPGETIPDLIAENEANAVGVD